MPFFDPIRIGASAVDTAYEIERSLRFNDDDNAYLNKTFSGAGNSKTFTVSFWFKMGNIPDSASMNAIGTGVNNQNDFMIGFSYDGSRSLFLHVLARNSSSTVVHVSTNRKFRDLSAWYHVVISVDTTQSTNSDRVKIYINGSQETSLSNSTYPSQNTDLRFNSANAHYVGTTRDDQTSSGNFDGYMAEVNSIDGLALTPSSFAETNAATGQWNPKKYVGSYGTNGFYLNFSDNSGTTATTLGKDLSGNGNNFTPNNFVTGDAVKDTPNNNFATLQMMGTPFSSGASFAEGNLKFTTGSSGSARNLNRQAFAPILVNSGKWYAEFVGTSSGNSNFIGVGPYQVMISPTANNSRYAYVYSDGNSYVRTAGSESIATYGGGIPVNNVVGVYLNMDASPPVVYFSSNGQWADGSGNFDESSPTGGLTLGDSFFTTDTGGNDGFAAFILSSAGSSYNMTIHANFGQDSTFAGLKTAGGNVDANGIGDFKYAVPTGAKALCSANLPDPTIKLPNKHFDTALYTGNGSTGQSISTLQFQPDFLWFKTRSDNRNHVVNDSVRGRAKGSYPDDTSAEFTDDAGRGLASFDANGFTVGEPQNASSHNKNGETIVTWAWNAGTSTVTNDDGDISSQVRANTTAGFSIVSYTGTGSAGDTVGHGLGVKPDVIITKRRNTSSNWGVYHQAITADKSLFLNLTNAEIDNSVYYNDTEPTSTVFTLGGSNESNGGNGDTYIAYCFSEVAGYSKFGKYTGNGNTNGTFVFTNFRPAVIILKRINSSASWVIHDNKRAGYNGDNDYLHPDNQQAESDGSSGTLDILSNGFKLRMTAGTHNGSGDSYIYLCFAESPFKNARAR